MIADVAIIVALLAPWALVALLMYDRHRQSPDLLALIEHNERLCQRLQAPHTAILEHHERTRAARSPEFAPPAVHPDLDEDYWEAKGDMAERLMDQERNGDR